MIRASLAPSKPTTLRSRITGPALAPPGRIGDLGLRCGKCGGWSDVLELEVADAFLLTCSRNKANQLIEDWTARATGANQPTLGEGS